jgi:hypothetical protein
VSNCPHCGTHLDAATSVNGSPEEDKPKDGDFSMCIECGGFSIFEKTAPGGIRLPTEAETAALNRSGMIYQLVKVWRSIRHGA